MPRVVHKVMSRFTVPRSRFATFHVWSKNIPGDQLSSPLYKKASTSSSKNTSSEKSYTTNLLLKEHIKGKELYDKSSLQGLGHSYLELCSRERCEGRAQKSTKLVGVSPSCTSMNTCTST
jgi:hypothetical protein